MNFGICRPSDRHLFLIGPTKLFIVCAWCFSVLLLPAAVAPPMPEPVRAVFEARCFKCHGPEKQKGKLRLDSLSADLINDRAAAETWRDVRAAINLGEMPPKEATQFEPEERTAVLDWLNRSIEVAVKMRQSKGGRVVLRRLNRVEYQNTMRDLFGLDIDYARDLPPDGVSTDNMRNNGSALNMSGIQMEYYLAAARNALDQVIVTNEAPKVFQHRFEKTHTKWARIKPTDRLGRGRIFIGLMKKDYPEVGEFRVRIRARAELPEQRGPIPRMRVSVGYRPDTLADVRTLAEIDITKEGTNEYEFRGRVENFPRPVRGQGKYPGLAVVIFNAHDEFGKLHQKEVVDAKGKKRKEFEDDPNYPYLVIESVAFEGPLFDAWPPPHHRRILFDSDLRETDEKSYAREVVERFLPRAWRRPVNEVEVDRFTRFFVSFRKEAATFEEAIRETLAMALISPQFLYLLEPAGGKQRPLDNYELASRLSYFLWSTMPDEELMTLANKGQLTQPRVLRQQVKRMIDDRRSWQFIEHFTSQWLDIDAMDRLEVDKKTYPGFRSELKEDMRQQTLHLFAEVLHGGLSSRHFLKSPFVMINDDLARHYGIDGVIGGEFRPVNLSPEHRDRRGGFLTQAGILLGRSTGQDSHLIKRAIFIRDHLLHDPPPPPPPNVPELKTSDPNFAKLPIREQLALHAEDPACADCHRGIDPWGQAMEQYDAVGRWRDSIRRGKTTLPMDARGKLPDGHEVNGIAELRDYLLEHREEQFARALVAKLLTYSLGRTLEFSDENTIESLTRSFVKDELRLRNLIQAIVASKAFGGK
ncbi:MAG: hypothetical protein ACI9OD_004980 [Limisphaerales bacterium]|jgi:hypothetical protein